MAPIMPPIPRYFFLIVQPLLALLGAIQPLIDPTSTTTALLSSPPRPPTQLESLLGLFVSNNIFLFAFIIIFIVLLSNDARLIHCFMGAWALSDISHWVIILWAFGQGDVVDGWKRGVVGGEWTYELAVHFWVPVLSFGMKVGYLTGFFGPDTMDKKIKRV